MPWKHHLKRLFLKRSSKRCRSTLFTSEMDESFAPRPTSDPSREAGEVAIPSPREAETAEEKEGGDNVRESPLLTRQSSLDKLLSPPSRPIPMNQVPNLSSQKENTSLLDQIPIFTIQVHSHVHHTLAIFDAIHSLTSILLTPFSVPIIWPELQQSSSLHYVLIWCHIYFICRFLAVTDKISPFSSEHFKTFPVVALLDIAARLIGRGPETQTLKLAKNFPISLLVIRHKFKRFSHSFGVFENWFLFHFTAVNKNHFLPVILWIILNLLVTGFLLGQTWLFISALDNWQSTMSPPGFVLENFWLKLSTSLFFGLQAAIAGDLPSIGGKEIYAETTLHFIFASSLSLVSIFLYAVSVGNLISIINSSQEVKQEFIDSMNNMENFLQKSNVPENIIKRCRKYYEFFNDQNEQSAENKENILARLPLHLQREIRTHVYMGAIFKTVKSFENVSDSFLTALCEFAQLEIALSGDILMYQGDVGDAMYIIKSGTVDVLVDDVPIAKLGDGDVIGEYCVLKEDEKRSASIRAIDDVTVYRLMREDFQKVSQAFPRDIAEIVNFSKNRLKDNSKKSVEIRKRTSCDSETLEKSCSALQESEQEKMSPEHDIDFFEDKDSFDDSIIVKKADKRTLLVNRATSSRLLQFGLDDKRACL